jgi:hypothetical protein
MENLIRSVEFRIFFFLPFFLIFSQIAFALSFNDLTQSDFSGTYYQTYYDSSGFIRLNQTIYVSNATEMTGSENGLVSYWRFNEASWNGTTGEVKDVLGISNGTAKNANTVSGKFGNAANFNGASGYINLTSNVSSSLGGASGATVSGWMLRKSPGVRNSIIDLSISATSSKIFFEFQADNTIRCGGRALPTDTFQAKITTSKWNDTNWHFVACTINLTANDVKIYVDGVQQSTTGTPAFGATTFSSFVGTSFILGAAAGPANFYNGMIDEFAVWKRTLDSSEIFALYQKGNSSQIVFYNGTYESNVKNAGEIVKWNNISWASNAISELPNNKVQETKFVNGNANMAGNILLLHMNEQSGAIVDYSGSGNNGTASGITYGTEGKMGTGLGFNGASSYINLGVNSIAPDLGSATGITLSAWIKPNSLQDSGDLSRNNIADLITSNNETKTEYNSTIYVTLRNGGKIWCGGRSLPTEGFQSIETAKTVTLGSWQHVVCVLDFTNKKVYVYYNGVKIGESTASFGSNTFVSGNPSGSGRDAIGAAPALNGYFFNGTMDEFALWNRTLSDTEIANVYKRGAIYLNLKLRSCDDGSCSGESYTDVSGASPQNLALANNQYFQYKFDFKTDNPTYSLELYNVSVNYEIPVIDTTPPQVKLISPANNTENTTSNLPIFAFNAIDDIASTLSCSLWMDNGTVQSYGTTMAVNATMTSITSSNQLSNGNYLWWINCSDGVNTNISEKRILSINIFYPETSPVITLIGTPTEIGTKWGTENKQTILTQYNTFHSSVGKTDAELKAFAKIFINNATSLNSTHWITEANAIADTIGVDRELFIAFISGRYRGLAQHYGEECTSFFVKPPATKNGEIIFHKTRDNSEELQSAYIKYTTGLPVGQEVYKFFAEMGTADTGLSYFVNEKGLAGSADQDGTADPPKYNGLMNHYTIRYIAEHSANVSEASRNLHFLVEHGYSAGATIITNWLFLDKDGNALHIEDDGHSIILEEMNPSLDYGGNTYPGIFFTIHRQDSSGSPEDALVANYGNVDVKLVDSADVAKHSAMTFTSSSLSGATFLINQNYPETLTTAFIALPAWGYSVPLLFGATATPKALMNATVYAYQKANVVILDKVFESQIHTEWETFYNDTKTKVPGQNVTDSLNDKFLYFVNKILNPNATSPPSELNATLINVTQEERFTHLEISKDPPYNSLVLYMPFDTDTSNSQVYDYSNLGNDGTYQLNSFTNISGGIYGGALKVNGAGNYVDLAKKDTVGGASVATISAWVNVHNTATRGAIYDETWSGTSNSRLFLEYQVDNTIRCGGRSQPSDSFQSKSTTLPVPTESWVHVVCVIDLANNNINIFINGISASTSGSPSFSSTSFTHTISEYQKIGSSALSGAYFNGLIDEFMIFNSSLTGAQISSIYNNQSLRFVKSGMQNFNPIDITPGYDYVNVTTNFQNLMKTNISLKIGFYNGSWFYTDSQNVTGLNRFSIANNSTKITLNYTFIPDDHQFYTPVWLNSSMSFGVGGVKTCGISANELNFGNVDAGQISSEKNVALTNTGNTPATILTLKGNDWTPSPGMSVGQTHWIMTSGINYDSMTAMTTSEASLGQQVSPGSPLPVYFKLQIPEGQTQGDYTQTVTFTGGC